MDIKSAAKAAFAADTGIAETGAYNDDMLLKNLRKKSDGNSSAKAAGSGDSAETRH